MAGINTPSGNGPDHIDVSWDYAVCAWARHFNTSEQELYVSVTCACAEDDIGWMRRNALRPA